MAAWLQELSGLPVAASNEAELQAQLKNGVVLCQAANRMGADITMISNSDERFEQISNIDKFLAFLKTTGAADRDVFVTTDLYDNKNMGQVMIGLNSLGRALHHVFGYSGPTVCQANIPGYSGGFRGLSSNTAQTETETERLNLKNWNRGEKCDRMRVVVCGARNVMAKTIFGSSSDCQCNLKFGSREHITSVVKGTLRPTWNVAFNFNYDKSNAHHDHLHVKVIHTGLLGPKLLGCVDVYMNTLDDTPDRCVTRWFELRPGPESKDRTRPRGEILLSILRHPMRFDPASTKLPAVIDPETNDRCTFN
jgi:hypothetical protein